MSGHPFLRPAGALCFLGRSTEIQATEVALEHALVMIVVGGRTGVGRFDVVAALWGRFKLSEDAFSVHVCPDGEFLVRFVDARVRARVAERLVRTPRFRLLFQPWSRSTGAEPISLWLWVEIKIRPSRSMAGTAPRPSICSPRSAS